MGVSHVKTNNVADATGTGTIWWGATTASVAATDMVRPSDWNSAHLQRLSFGGNTAGVASVTGTDVIFAGGNNVTLSAAQGAGVGTVSFIGANPGVSAFSAGTTRLTGGEAVLSDANGISFGMNGATITASHNALVKTDADALYFPRASSTAPNGFPDRTQLTMGWSNATRTVTLTPVAASFDVWSNGTKYTKSSAQTVTIANTTGLHYVYFDDSGTLVSTMTFGTNLILRWAIVAIIYWNATDGTAIPDCQVETHGTDWPPEVHLQQHLVAGCRYQSGLSVSVQPEQDGSSLSHIQVAVTSGYIWDEDIQHAVAARVAGDNIPVLYRSGASGVWSMSASSSAMVRTTGSGRAAFNEYTGGSWQQTEMTNGYYGVAYLYAMPSLTGAQQLVVVQGQAQYATQADAGAAAQQTPALGDLPLYEVKLIAAIVFQTDSGLTNAVKSRTMRIGDSSGADFVDWRLQSAIVTDVGNLGDGYNIIAAGTQTALSTGTVLFSNSNNVTFGMTNSSVVTAAFALPVSGGTTSGALSSLVFSSGGNVTFGLDGSTLTASAPAGGGGGIAAAAGTQTATSGTVVFSNSNGVSFGMSGSTRVTASFSQSSATISAGTTSGTLGQLVFSNSGNVSFGLNAGTVTATVTVPAQTNQTIGEYFLGNTTAQSSSSTWDARSLSFAGAGIVSIGNSAGSGIVISATQSNQAFSAQGGSSTFQTLSFQNGNGATFTNNAGAIGLTYTVPSAWISAGTTSGSLSTLVFSNSGNVSFGLNAGTITATATVPAQTAQTLGIYASSNTTGASSSSTVDARSLTIVGYGVASVGMTNGSLAISVPSGGGAGDGYNILAAGTQTATTAGSVLFSNENGVTFGMQGSTRITASVAALTSATISAGTTTGTLGQLVFSNSNNMSFGLNAGTITGTVTVPAQTAQTVGWYALGNTTAQSSSSTWDARTLSVAGAGIISIGNSAGSGLVVSATQSNQALSGSNGSFAFQTATFGNLNGLSFYTSNGSFVGSYTVPTQSNQTLGLYASSNTTGAASSTTIDARSMTLVGYGIASVGMTNGSVAISVPSGGGAGDGVNILAAGTQTANTTGTVVFSNSNGISFGMNNSSVITASVAAGVAPNRRYIEIMNGERLTSCAALSATQFSNRPIFSPFWLDGTGIQVNTMRFLVSGVGSSNRSFGGTFVAAIYSQANDTQLTLLSSDSQSFSITASSQSTLWNGMNVVDFTGMSNLTLTAEGRHVAAFMIRPVSANATWMSAQLYGGDNLPAISRFLVGNTTSATNNTSNIFPFWGVYSTTSGAMPSSLHATQINGGNSASLVDYYCIIKEI